MVPNVDPDEAERDRLKAIVIDTKEELVASFSEFEPLDSASWAGIKAGAMVFKLLSVKVHPDKRNHVATYFNALNKFRNAWLTGTRHNVQMTTCVADFLEPPFDTRVTPHVRIEEGDFVASGDDLRDPVALLSDLKSANLWTRLIDNAGGLERMPIFEPHRFEDFERDIQNLELASIVYISMADQKALLSGTVAVKRKLRQKINTASHVLLTGEGESVTIVHRDSGNTRVMADKELYPRCSNDSVRRRTEFLNRVHSFARSRRRQFQAVFSHRGGRTDRVSGTIAAANILATIGAQAWNKPIPWPALRAEEPGYVRNDEDSRAWGAEWQDLLGIPAQQYLNARQLLVINSGVESPFALGTKANSAAIIAATEWNPGKYTWTVSTYTRDAQVEVVDLGDDDDAPNDGADAHGRAQPTSDAPAAAEARSPASDAPAGDDAQPTEDRAQPPSDATAASEDVRQTEGSNDLHRSPDRRTTATVDTFSDSQSQFSSPRSGQPSPQGYQSSFSDGSPGQGIREHLDWENEQYQATEYNRQQQLTAEERDAESPAPQAADVEEKKALDGDAIGIAQTNQEAQPAAEAQPVVEEQPALDPEQGAEHPDADQALELCNTENIFLDQGIASFCDCFTVGTKWLSLHNIVGCCKGGTSKSRRQAKGQSCGSLKCGRCMWEKESDTGAQCDAIAVGSNETRRTGCFHCKQSVGPIAIFNDPSHTCEHFPKYDLNGTRHGWCFNRVARHKDFAKRQPDWTTIRIYSSLTAEAGRRRDNEAQAQERIRRANETAIATADATLAALPGVGAKISAYVTSLDDTFIARQLEHTGWSSTNRIWRARTIAPMNNRDLESSWPAPENVQRVREYLLNRGIDPGKIETQSLTPKTRFCSAQARWLLDNGGDHESIAKECHQRALKLLDLTDVDAQSRLIFSDCGTEDWCPPMTQLYGTASSDKQIWNAMTKLSASELHLMVVMHSGFEQRYVVQPTSLLVDPTSSTVWIIDACGSRNDPDLTDTETEYVIVPLQKIAETQASKTGNSDDDDLDGDTGSDDVTPTVASLRRSARHQTITISDESFGDRNWTELNTEGYVILEGAALKCLRMDTLDHLKPVMKVVHTLSNGPDPRDDDGGRWQEDFPENCKDADLVETLDKLTALCESLFPGLSLSSPLILVSRARCRTQRPAHTDADTEKFSVDDTVVPLSIMIALQKDTRVILYPGSHNWIRNGGPQQSRGKLFTLKRGDVIVWRGDLVHQGAPYKTPNMRLFFEAYPPGHKVEINKIDDGTSKVVYRNHPVEVKEPDSPKEAGEEEADELPTTDETGEATEGD